MVFNRDLWVKCLTNQGKCAMWAMWICFDRDVWGKMITRLVNDGLNYPYKISQSLFLMISIINSKMFVNKPVDKYALISHRTLSEGLLDRYVISARVSIKHPRFSI